VRRACRVARCAVLLGASCPASAGIRGALAASRIAAAGPITPVRACSALPHMNLGSVPDAPGKVTSAVVVHGTPPAKPVLFCDVNGIFAPKSHFDTGTPQGTITLQQKVRPYNALTPVTPAKGT